MWTEENYLSSRQWSESILFLSNAVPNSNFFGGEITSKYCQNEAEIDTIDVVHDFSLGEWNWFRSW